MKLYYYEVITTYSSDGYFSGFVVETEIGVFDFFNEDSDSAEFYGNIEEFTKHLRNIDDFTSIIRIE